MKGRNVQRPLLPPYRRRRRGGRSHFDDRRLRRASTNSAICTEASWSKAFTDYSTAAAAGAGDLNKFNEATAKLATDLKTLAGTADGDLATALTDLATSFDRSRSTRTTRPPPPRPWGR